MRAVVVEEPGGPDALTVKEMDEATPAAGEVVLDVAAAGVNRADVLQREGRYDPPPGATRVLGLECSGTVSAVGEDADGWSVGDEACALLSGGAYAEQVAVPVGQLARVPTGVGLVDAGGLVEVAATVWANVFMSAALQRDEMLLVHGGGSGIGTMAIQLAHALGARVAVTAGSQAKLDVCRDLGADVLVNYREQDFVDQVKDATDGRGADVILDNMGAAYLGRNLDALATNGRLVVIGLQGGTKGELDLGAMLVKRVAVMAASLRARPPAEKAGIVASMVEHVWPLLDDATVRPVIHTTFALDDVADAHRVLDESSHIGKVLLVP